MCAQRLRGRRYLEDGALVPSDVAEDGRWVAPEDAHAWHLTVWSDGGLTGTLWYLAHAPGTPVTRMHSYSPINAEALQTLVDNARDQGTAVHEMGGWAAVNNRGNLQLLLTSLAMMDRLHPVIAPVIITTRHRANRIVRRWATAPPGTAVYTDPKFGQMELLVVDSRVRDVPYRTAIDAIVPTLDSVPVLRIAA